MLITGVFPGLPRFPERRAAATAGALSLILASVIVVAVSKPFVVVQSMIKIVI
jgi:hypothetical protein